MGIILHGVNTRNGNLPLTIFAKDILNYLGWGLKKKYGVYAPMSEQDCLILARILHTKANWLQIGDQLKSIQDAFNIFMIVNGEKHYMVDADTIDMIHIMAAWFEKCGGLRSVDGYDEE